MTHKFLPPASVNYSKPFRFVIAEGSTDKNIYEHSYNAQDEIVVTNLTTGVQRPWYNHEWAVRKNVSDGSWLVIDESDSLAKKFDFINSCGVKFTYTQVGSNSADISWVTNGERFSRLYDIKVVRELIETGSWTVLPTAAQTAEQSSENAFKALEDVVRNHKQLNMQNGSKVVFATGGERPWKSASDTTLDTIKAFTQSGKFSVGIHKGVYTVYGRDDEYKATSDKQLVEVMKALETLVGCV